MADPSITLGAQLAAAGRTLGMSPDETMALVHRKALQNGISDDAALSAFLEKMGEVQALNEEMPGRIDSLRTIPNNEVEFGELGNQDALQNFGGMKDGKIKNIEQQLVERERAGDKRDPNEIVRYYFDKAKKKPAKETFYADDGVPIPARFQEAAKGRDFGVYEKAGGEDEGIYVQRGDQRVFRQFGQEVADPKDIKPPKYIQGAGNNANLAPAQQIMRDELARLQLGIDQFGADAFPGIADAAGRLEAQIQGDAGAERSLARELVRRDLGNVNLDAVKRNDQNALSDARRLFMEGYPGPQIFNQMGDIGKNGPAKIGDDFSVTRRVPGREVEPTSLPVSLPEDLNAPVTDNRFVGPLQKQAQWLAQHAPGYREGKIFGDFPQVAIDAQLQRVEEALANIKLGNQGIQPTITQIRNIDDLQQAADAIIAASGGRGLKIREGNENVYVENPGIHEVLRKAKFNDNMENELARALFQVEAAARAPRNIAQKIRFEDGLRMQLRGGMGGRQLVNVERDGQKVPFVVRAPNGRPVGGAQHQLLGGGQVGVGRINREKIEGREVKAELQKLQGNQAQPPLDFQELRNARMPDQAVVAGEKAPRAHFIRGEDVNLSTGELIAKHGKARGELAAKVRRRAIEDDARRQDAAPPENRMGDIRGRVRRDGVGAPVPGMEYEANDPWTKPIGTGDGLTATAPAQTEQPKWKRMGYMSAPDTSGRGARDRREVIRRLERGAARRAAGTVSAAVGGTILGIAGLDSMINGEKRKREEEAYA